VVVGLLYGNGDFTATMEITTRCGQDADCNPSSAGGILGAMIGYEAIPQYWKLGLKEAESLDFKFTSTSLNDVYEIGTKHALLNIEKNGGKISGDDVFIKTQIPKAVKFEQSFAGHYPTDKSWVGKNLEEEYNLEFEGNGFVLKGEAYPKNSSAWNSRDAKVLKVEVYLDNQLTETIELPTNFITRRHEIAWKYQLPDQKHSIKLKLLEPDSAYVCRMTELIWYSSKPQNKITIGSFGTIKKKTAN
jgi:hypothetical protein